MFKKYYLKILFISLLTYALIFMALQLGAIYFHNHRDDLQKQFVSYGYDALIEDFIEESKLSNKDFSITELSSKPFKKQNFQVNHSLIHPIFSLKNGIGIKVHELLLQTSCEQSFDEQEPKSKSITLQAQGLRLYPSLFHQNLRKILIDNLFFLESSDKENKKINDLKKGNDNDQYYFHFKDIDCDLQSGSGYLLVDNFFTPSRKYSIGSNRAFKIEKSSHSKFSQNFSQAQSFHVEMPSILFNTDEMTFNSLEVFVDKSQLWWKNSPFINIFKTTFQSHLNFDFNKKSLSASLHTKAFETKNSHYFDDFLDTTIDFQNNIQFEKKDYQWIGQINSYIKGEKGVFELFNPYLLKKNINIFKKIFASKKKNQETVFSYDTFNAHLLYEKDQVNIINFEFLKGQSKLNLKGHYIPSSDRYKVKFYFLEKKADNLLSFSVKGQGEDYSLRLDFEDFLNTVPEVLPPILDTLLPFLKN